MVTDGETPDYGDYRCYCSEFMMVTEAAAMAAGRWMGQGNSRGADGAAVEAMRASFHGLPVNGTVVIGEREKEEVPRFHVGEKVGGGGRLCDVAVDPLEGTDICARGQGGAMSILLVGAPGNIMSVPDMYMQKLVVGAPAAGCINIDDPVKDNLERIAEAYERRVSEITVIILDRPRHEDLVAEVRKAGARIKLILAGDISASIAAAVQGTGDHAYIGIGGATQGVITAAAMRCLGGEIQAKLWPLSRREIQRAQEHGIEDIESTLLTDDMVRGDLVLAATGVTTGDFLKGVDYFPDGARTHTLVMCTKCRNVRFVDTVHLFSETRRSIWL